MFKLTIFVLFGMLCLLYPGIPAYADESTRPPVDLLHRVSVFGEFWSQPVIVANREFEFEPSGVSLNYEITINRQWFVGLGFGRFDDNFSEHMLKGMYTHDGMNMGIGYTQANWWFSIWYNQQQEETELNSHRPASGEFAEQVDYSAYAIDISRAFDGHQLSVNNHLSYEIGTNIEYQQEDGTTTTELRSERGVFVEQSQFDGNGWLAGITLSASYDHSLQNTTGITAMQNTVIATLSFNWSEPLTGDSHGSSVVGGRTRDGKIYRIRSEQSDDNDEGSGQLEFSLSWLISNLSLVAGAAFPVESGFDSNTMDDQKSLYLGADVFF